VAEAVESFGRLDILVNNAGSSATGDSSRDRRAWQADLDLKLFAAVRLSAWLFRT